MWTLEPAPLPLPVRRSHGLAWTRGAFPIWLKTGANPSHRPRKLMSGVTAFVAVNRESLFLKWRGALEMACKISWQAQHFLNVGVAGRYSRCCQARLGAPCVVTSAALWRCVTGAAPLELAGFVAGATFPAFACVFAWQGQHLAAV